MTNTVHYFCKYTPVEIFEAFGVPTESISHMPLRFENSEQILGSNICGFGKALVDLIDKGEVKELVMTSCCDTIRAVYDVMKSSGKMDFVFFLDVPHVENGCSTERFASSIKELITSYEQYSGKTFSTKLFINALERAAKRPERGRPYIALLGGRAGSELFETCQEIMPLPVVNNTCVMSRTFCHVPSKSFRGMTMDELLLEYAHMLLSMMPCMRMSDRTGRKELFNDPDLTGIIYHTIRFCDFYSFEYSDIKSSTNVPLLKIETDYTDSSTGQLKTRLEAFAEEMSIKCGSSGADNDHVSLKSESGFFAGIDSGSASTDVVIIDKDRNIISGIVIPTGAGAAMSAEKALSRALEKAGLKAELITHVVTTGYGRCAIDNADKSITEITCHARGAHFLDPKVRTVIDIGGQDSKVITLDENGNVTNFVMNDKCAAGTGRFLDMMSGIMEMSLDEMSTHGISYKEDITISSTCTVFAESEVVSLIAQNKACDDIVHGLNKAVASKTAALCARVSGSAPYMMTGGVSRNKGLVKALEDKLSEKEPGTKLIISDKAQLCGALGAALFALEMD